MYTIRFANARGHVQHGWLDARHSFSFGSYYDRNFMGFSDLRVINEDRIMPTMGFDTHPHKDMEILTYVLSGAIAHKDSMGNQTTLSAGEFQIMSAGTGILHSEFNPSADEWLHLLQIWIMPSHKNITPRYDQKRFANQEGATLILSPDAQDGALKIHQDMQLWRYQWQKNHAQDIPLDPKRSYWLQLVQGALVLGENTLTQGDGVAIQQEKLLSLRVAENAEFLLFDLR